MVSFSASLLSVSGLAAIATAASVGSIGCGKNLKTSLKPGGPSRNFNFDSNAGKDKKINIKRRVRIALPANYKEDVPAPVIVAFAPKYRNGTSFEVMTQFSNSDLNPDAITVFPDGVDLIWTGDPYAPATEKNSDIIYAGELLDQVSDNFCVDRSRIYAAGFDNGGSLVHLLGCDRTMSKRIAAFAMTAAPVYTDEAMNRRKTCRESLYNADRCKPGRRVPILNIHGDENDIVSYHGESFEGETLPVPEVMKLWVEKNGCDVRKGNNSEDIVGGRAKRFTYNCGPEDKPLVTHYLLHGLAHEWPYVPSEEGMADSSYFDGTETIMKFFNQHKLPDELVPEIDETESAIESATKGEPPSATEAQKAAETQKEVEKEIEKEHGDDMDKANEAMARGDTEAAEGALKKAMEGAARIANEKQDRDEL